MVKFSFEKRLRNGRTETAHGHPYTDTASPSVYFLKETRVSTELHGFDIGDSTPNPSERGAFILGTSSGPICVGDGCGGPEPTAPPGCGDGILTPDEACDDGNRQGEDGCASNCLRVEAGFSRAVAGQACERIAVCGDGVLSSPEFCDDGNRTDRDGCPARCKVELGHQCEGTPSAWTATLCGDGEIEAYCGDGIILTGEDCDDGCDNSCRYWVVE